MSGYVLEEALAVAAARVRALLIAREVTLLRAAAVVAIREACRDLRIVDDATPAEQAQSDAEIAALHRVLQRF